MRIRSACLTLFALSGTVTFASCSQAPVSGVGLSMNVPQGVLDEATGVTLYVFDAEDRACTADGGIGGEVPEDATDFDLEKCDGGWCGEITLQQSDVERMFFVEVRDAAGLLAQGCSTAVVDQDPLVVDIQVIRFVDPACCGDATLQVGELCDEGGDDTCGGTTADAICAADCTTKNVWLDDNGVDDPEDNGQGNLSIAFTPGSGQLSGGLRAAWETATTASDIGFRVLQDDLTTITDPAVLDHAHKVYFRCTGEDVTPLRDQKNPSIDGQGSGAVLAFLSAEEVPLQFDARVLGLNAVGCSDMLESLLVSNGTAPVDSVDVATGPSDAALIVWEQNGTIFGRTFDGTTLGGETITIGDGANPQVAGSSAGWVVVYEGSGGGDTDGILMNRVSSALVVGDVILVNEETSGAQDQPDVALVNDGSAAVVWRSGGDIFLQRFSGADARVEEDRAGPANTTTDGNQSAPTVAASSSNDFFVLAWENGTEIRARFAGKSAGFRFNAVSGRNDDFAATTGASAPRRPALASSSFVAIAWEDLGAGEPGLFVRRFPLPEE